LNLEALFLDKVTPFYKRVYPGDQTGHAAEPRFPLALWFSGLFLFLFLS
jgi:hypothetical protein